MKSVVPKPGDAPHWGGVRGRWRQEKIKYIFNIKFGRNAYFFACFNHLFYELPQDLLIQILNKKFWEELIACFAWYDTDRMENDASNNYSILRVYSLRL
jgi:hypothetical protein